MTVLVTVVSLNSHCNRLFSSGLSHLAKFEITPYFRTGFIASSLFVGPVKILRQGTYRSIYQPTVSSVQMRPDTPAGDHGVLVGDVGEDKFLYFAYGSNLLAKRIHLMNPSAVRQAIAKLQDYRLDFSLPASIRWGGAPATAVPDSGHVVWGAVWSLDARDRDTLDEQEAVPSGLYDVFNATVETPSGQRLVCRCYRMHVEPAKLPPGEPLPTARQPSRVYKQVILAGARESGLPQEYIARLEAIPDNGSAGYNPPVSLDMLQHEQR